MPRAVFADAGFWVAMTRRRDQYRARSLAWQRWLTRHKVRLVTTEAVLWEWLNGLAAPDTRQQAANGYERCRNDESVELVPFEQGLIQAAFTLYASRQDKGWSLTDCCSFIVMQERRLTDA